MTLFLKQNKVLLICILCLILSIVVILTKYKLDFDESVIEHEKIIKYLEENPNLSGVQLKEPMMYDAYSLFSYATQDTALSIIIIISPFVVMLCGVYNFYLKLKSGYFKLECMRRSYQKNIILNILSSWKNAMIIPIYVVTLLLLGYVVTGNFNIENTINYYGYSLINPNYINMLPNYFLVYTINLVLVSICYINISLIVAKRGSNLFVVLTQSYLIFVVLGIITEVFLGRGLEQIFPTLINYNICNSLSLFAFWHYDNVYSLNFMSIYAFVLFLISTIILILNYRNKESVIIESDK